jgi:hypothetical protein
MESEDRLAATARRRGKAPPHEPHPGEMSGNPTKARHAALFTLQLAIACALFSLDIFLGPGMADGIGYSIVLVLCLWNPKRTYSLGWAGFSTLLVIVGGIISPDHSVIHAASINRVLEICTIWVIWFLIGAIAPKRSD